MAVTTQDSELLVQFRDPATKESAYTSIIKKYQEKLYWHVRRMVIDHEDANDVLQNVFIRVWNALENFREDSQLYTWLYRIATNECLTFLEQQKNGLQCPWATWKAGWKTRSRPISILMPPNWNGSCNWLSSNCLKSRELYLACGIMTKCLMKKCPKY